MQKHSRIACLDEFRGFLLVLMAFYHAQWNLQFLFGHPQEWFVSRPGIILQFFICTSFILLAGACTRFCRNHYKRSVLMIGVAIGVTVVTTVFMYESRIIFGILHLLAVSQLLYTVSRPLLEKIPPAVGATLFGFLFLITYHVPERVLGVPALGLCISLPDSWYTRIPLSVLGFLAPGFFSADYFPIIPYIFAFFCGHYLGHWIDRIPEALRRPHCPPLGWMGRHSLIIYLAHQPFILGVMMLIFG